jgi:hypothetical protein
MVFSVIIVLISVVILILATETVLVNGIVVMSKRIIAQSYFVILSDRKCH